MTKKVYKNTTTKKVMKKRKTTLEKKMIRMNVKFKKNFFPLARLTK